MRRCIKLLGEAAIYHFISGLPRSGSTLMGAILRQNRRFHAGMSSPVASLFEGIIAQVSAGSEISTMVNTGQRARLLRGLFDSYYAEVKADVIFRYQPRLVRAIAGSDDIVSGSESHLLRARCRLGDGLARTSVSRQCV